MIHQVFHERLKNEGFCLTSFLNEKTFDSKFLPFRGVVARNIHNSVEFNICDPIKSIIRRLK